MPLRGSLGSTAGAVGGEDNQERTVRDWPEEPPATLQAAELVGDVLHGVTAATSAPPPANGHVGGDDLCPRQPFQRGLFPGKQFALWQALVSFHGPNSGKQVGLPANGPAAANECQRM